MNKFSQKLHNGTTKANKILVNNPLVLGIVIIVIIVLAMMGINHNEHLENAQYEKSDKIKVVHMVTTSVHKTNKQAVLANYKYKMQHQGQKYHYVYLLDSNNHPYRKLIKGNRVPYQKDSKGNYWSWYVNHKLPKHDLKYDDSTNVAENPYYYHKHDGDLARNVLIKHGINRGINFQSNKDKQQHGGGIMILPFFM